VSRVALPAIASLGLLLTLGDAATAQPPVLAGLAPADDARKAIALGPSGEVYEPDGAGAWVRTKQISTASTLSIIGRTGDGTAGQAIVASGEGVVYRLAPNGWSAIRLAQKGDAVMSRGPRAVGAVKRQLYALDRWKGGEPEKLATAPAPVLAMGSGKSIVVATERGMYRIEGAKLTPLTGIPAKVSRLVSDRWAIVGSGAIDLRTRKTTSWPAGASITATTVGPADELVAVATIAGKLELLTIRAAKLQRAPITIDPGGSAKGAIGVVVDRGGRAVVAFSDGRLLLRNGSAWTSTTVGDAIPDARPGPAPATSP
jgi:hypothetical protein